MVSFLNNLMKLLFELFQIQLEKLEKNITLQEGKN